MRKLFLMFLVGIFLVSLASAALYDDFDDNSLDTSLWTNDSFISGGGFAGFDEINEQIEMTVNLSGASQVINVNLTTDSILSIGTINWTLVAMETSLYGGGGKWTYCGIEVGGTEIIFLNRTTGSVTGNYSTGNWTIFGSGADVIIANASGTQRTMPLPSGKLSFNCKAETSGSGGAASMIQHMDTVFLDLTPSVILSSPEDNNNTANSNVDFSVLSASGASTLENTTLKVWFNNGSLFNSFLNDSISGNQDTATWTVPFTLINNYLWNAETCFANNTCVFATSNNTLKWGIGEIGDITRSPIPAFEIFNSIYNTSFETGATTVSGVLWYNGTSYDATVGNPSGNIWNLSATVLHPSLTSVGDNNMWFEITYDGGKINQTSESEIVYNLSLGQCNSTLTTTYLNFSFKDESDSSFINATISSSTFAYWGNTQNTNKSFTFSNTTANDWYTFCSSQSIKNLSLDLSMQYASSGYPQRLYNPDTLNIGNVSTNKILYLLATADGLYATFQVINLADQPVSGVDVSATRVTDSVVVGTGTTDAAGLVTFWLNPDFQHTLVFEKSGYDSFTTTLYPTQSSYTITLGSEAITINDFSQGISLFLNPASDFLDNLTNYEFNLSIASSYWELERFGFSLYYGNDTLIGTNSSTASTGGFISLVNVNATSDQTYIYMDYYYLISGNYTNSSRQWIIQPTYGRSFSIWNFFTDLGTYIDSGFFGFDDFGKVLLSVLIIVMVGGGLAYNYGLRSEVAVMGLIFSVVFFLDVGIGFIPRIQVGSLTAVPYFPTIITFIILFAIVIREEKR